MLLYELQCEDFINSMSVDQSILLLLKLTPMNGNVNTARFSSSSKMENELYSQVPPLPPRFRLRDLILGDTLAESDRYK